MFLEDTQSIFIAKQDFRYGYDPYNTVDVLRILYSVISAPRVSSLEATAPPSPRPLRGGKCEPWLIREFRDES